MVESGATEVYAACSHGVLSEPALQWVNDSPIKELLLTVRYHSTYFVILRQPYLGTNVLCGAVRARDYTRTRFHWTKRKRYAQN
jgi:hypothetical protein